MYMWEDYACTCMCPRNLEESGPSRGGVTSSGELHTWALGTELPVLEKQDSFLTMSLLSRPLVGT